jgi:predicted ATP-grasp superfamily ATP-dependent carboligase
VVLFPVADAMVWRLAQMECEGRISAMWVHPSLDILKKCLDKLFLSEWVANADIPSPLTCRLAEIAKGERKVPFPFIVKPRNNISLDNDCRQKLLRGAKLFEVTNNKALDDLLLTLDGDWDNWIVQEPLYSDAAHLPIYIAGYITQKGEGVAFSHRKLCTSPPRAGVGVYIESAHLPEYEERIVQWLARSGYRGVFGIEMLYNAKTGEYALVDFNPRFGTGDTIGLAFGINLPLVAYKDAIGEPVHLNKRVPSRPLRWVAELWYIGAGRQLMRTGEIDLWNYLCSWCYRPLWYGLWDIHDPLPFFVVMLRSFIRLRRRRE